MNAALDLFRLAASAITSPTILNRDTIQPILAKRLVSSVEELSEDYIRFSKRQHARTRAVIARTSLEAAFRLQATLQSADSAARIAYTSAEDDLKRAKQLKSIDPSPPKLADEVISSLEAEVSFLRDRFGDSCCKTMKVLQIAEAAGCISYYRSHYFNLSQYIHSSYSTASAPSSLTANKISDESILLALCMSSESIATFFSHTDLEDIRIRARSIWNERS